MALAELPPKETETERVEHWREQELKRAGYPPAEAFELAHTLTVDLHHAIDLLVHGCPYKTALRILR